MQEMLTAITRRVGARINHCELAYLKRRVIDVDKAAAQHARYEDCLRALGARVVSLAPEPDLPDAVFVEDPAVVLDEVAVIARMGAASRRPEAESLAAVLAPFRPLLRMEEPATLEGGDVVRVGATLFVGVSERTNQEGVRQLKALVEPWGYAVRAIEVRGCMHLKTGCCYLGEGAVLANRAWVDVAALGGLRVIDVSPEEPWAADVLLLGKTVIMPDSLPATRRLLEGQGWKVEAVDVSELMKAEAGVTCMSILFQAD